MVGPGLDRANEAIATSRQRFDVARNSGRIAQRVPQSTNDAVQALFEVDEGAQRPEARLQFLARHDVASVLEQREEHLNALVRYPLPDTGAQQFARTHVDLEGVERVAARRRGLHDGNVPGWGRLSHGTASTVRKSSWQCVAQDVGAEAGRERTIGP